MFDVEKGSAFVASVLAASKEFEESTLNFTPLSSVLPGLRATLTQTPAWTQQPMASNQTVMPEIRRHADIDALFIGISHDECDWGTIPMFSKHFSMKFRAAYEKRSGSKYHGSLVITSEDALDDVKRKIPMRSLKQRLVATVQLGLFKCDLVVFGPESETYLRTNFYPRVKEALLLASKGCEDETNNLNHLFSVLSVPDSHRSATLDPKEAASILRGLQCRLGDGHHLAVISLGCTSMGLVREVSDELAGKELARVYDDLLCESLDMAQIKSNATYLLSDNGIEFSSSGRYLHWKPEACRMFKNAMGGGSCYFDFGIRRLTAFNMRAMLFERSDFLSLIMEPTNQENYFRHPEHKGVVPQLPTRKKDGSLSSLVIGKCAYSRSSDMLGRGRDNPLTKINFVEHLTEVVLWSGHDSTNSKVISLDAKARQALGDAQSHVKEYIKRLGTQFHERRRVEARGEVTCVRFIFGVDDPERFDVDWSSGVADVFDRMLIPGHLSSVDTVVLGDLSRHFTELLWAFMRRLGTSVLDARAISSCFGLGRLHREVDSNATILHLVAMTAFCEQTLTHTLPFCNVMGVPGLCDAVSRVIGWENPLEAFVRILGRPEVDIARFVTHNRLSQDTKRSDARNRLQIRRLLGAHISLRQLLASIDRASVSSMSHQELARHLLLPVRLCIAQYSEEVRAYIARYWAKKASSIPELVYENSGQFASLGIRVESVTSAAWKSRFTDFGSLLACFSAKSFRNTWTFPRILQTVIVELSLSQVQVSECLLVLFQHQAHSYGRLWTSECLGGVGMFGHDQDFSGSRQSNLVDAGLLTLVHPKNPNRIVANNGKLVLLCRSWPSIPRQTSTAPVPRPGNEGTVSHPSWSKPFFDCLVWLREFDWALFPSALEETIPHNAKLPKPDKAEKPKRVHMNVFMIVVTSGLFCRVMHLKALSASQNYAAFKTLLFDGCSHEDPLWQAEIKFLDTMKSVLTLGVAKEILAFYQSGILGMHSCSTVCEKLRNLPDGQLTDIKELMRTGQFQIDKHWLLNRAFMQAYRAKSTDLEMPIWVAAFVRAHSARHTALHMGGVNHVAVPWIIPRYKEEALTAPIPLAFRSVLKPIPELEEITVPPPSIDEFALQWTSPVQETLEVTAIPDSLEDDLVLEGFLDEEELFAVTHVSEIVDEVFISIFFVELDD